MTSELRGLDLFSGLGAASIAMRDAGVEVVAHSEIERFPCAVLAHRFPGVPNLGDITKIEAREVERRFGRVDLISGGWPCQDLSVAGKRAGLAGARSNLFWHVIRLADELRPRWLVLENVPGIFSSNGGRDFGTVLWALGKLGYGVAWRVLDAQHFGVPQRRRRVFIVGYLGGACPPEILFESEGVPGDLTPGEKTGEEVVGILGGGANQYKGFNGFSVEAFTNRGIETGSVAETLRSGSHGALPMVAGTLGGGSGSRGWAQDTDQMTFVPELSAANEGSRRMEGVIGETKSTHGGSADNRIAALYLKGGDLGGMTVRRLTPL